MPSERVLAMEAFLRQAGWSEAKISPLAGDASTRRYARLELGGKKAMLMDQPQNAETATAPASATPQERQALGYNAVARLAGADCGRFVAVAQFLRTRGLSAPQIIAADIEQGFVLLEDLGDRLYADRLDAGDDEASLYSAAALLLARLHAENAPLKLAENTPLHAYDETALLAETDLLTEWYFPFALDRDATADEIAEHRTLWHTVLGSALSSPATFVHRDYHAQNLLWLPERDGVARVGLIDFQDAVCGSRAYDLASLIEDARRDVSPELGLTIVEYYLAAMRAQGAPLDAESFRAELAVMAAQRNVKIVGIFARLYKRDGKPRYLSYLPRVWTYLERDLRHPALAALKAWYDRKVPHDLRFLTSETVS